MWRNMVPAHNQEASSSHLYPLSQEQQSTSVSKARCPALLTAHSPGITHGPCCACAHPHIHKETFCCWSYHHYTKPCWEEGWIAGTSQVSVKRPGVVLQSHQDGEVFHCFPSFFRNVHSPVTSLLHHHISSFLHQHHPGERAGKPGSGHTVFLSTGVCAQSISDPLQFHGL